MLLAPANRNLSVSPPEAISSKHESKTEATLQSVIRFAPMGLVHRKRNNNSNSRKLKTRDGIFPSISTNRITIIEFLSGFPSHGSNAPWTRGLRRELFREFSCGFGHAFLHHLGLTNRSMFCLSKMIFTSTNYGSVISWLIMDAYV